MKRVICGAGMCVLVLSGLCLADAGGGSPAKESTAQPVHRSAPSPREKPIESVPGPVRGNAAPRTAEVSRPIQATSSEAIFTYDALGRLVEIVRPSGR